MGSVSGSVKIGGTEYPVSASLSLPTSGDPRWIIGSDGLRYRPNGTRWDQDPVTGDQCRPEAYPRYSGSLTPLKASQIASAGPGTAANPKIYENVVLVPESGPSTATPFPFVIGDASRPISHIQINGVRATGSSPQNAAIVLYGDDIGISYFDQNVAVPAGQFISMAQSFEYGITWGSGYGAATNVKIRRWKARGFGNAATQSGPGPHLVDECYLVEACTDPVPSNPSSAYHNDGVPGYLNGTDGISHMTVSSSVINFVGNTNPWACQQGTYDDILGVFNMEGGGGYTHAQWATSTNTRQLCAVFDTLNTCIWGPLYGQDFLAHSPTNKWGGPGQENLWRSANPDGSKRGWGNPANHGKLWKYTPGVSIGNPQTNDSLFVA